MKVKRFDGMKGEFVPYELAVKLKELGFNKPCFKFYNSDEHYSSDVENISEWYVNAPLWQQTIKFLYLGSNGKINIEINGKDSYKELCKKLDKAIEDFRNL